MTRKGSERKPLLPRDELSHPRTKENLWRISRRDGRVGINPTTGTISRLSLPPCFLTCPNSKKQIRPTLGAIWSARVGILGRLFLSFSFFPFSCLFPLKCGANHPPVLLISSHPRFVPTTFGPGPQASDLERNTPASSRN